MRRRALLAALGGTATAATAGCLDSVPGSGGDDGCGFEITSARAGVGYWCLSGTGMELDARATATDCDGELTLELVQNGEVVYAITESDSSGSWRFHTRTTDGTPGPGTVRFRLRDGEAVVAEETAEVEHYLDAPGAWILNPTITPRTTTVGEPVTVTIPVARKGGPGEFTVMLSVDGETVWQREGTIEGGWDCGDASGPTFEATHAFAEPGTYEIGASLSFHDSAGSGDAETVGTVTVE